MYIADFRAQSSEPLTTQRLTVYVNAIADFGDQISERLIP